jgi:CubicO group peptidase (beta-lactamase class C family)
MPDRRNPTPPHPWRQARAGIRRAAPAVLAAWLFAGCGGTPSSPPVTQFDAPAASLAEFETRLDALRRDLNIPGLGLAIASGQRLVWVRGLGLADVENAVAPAANTNFHLASLTKTYASTVLLQLVEEGRLSLDDPVSRYGVSVPGTGVVTVRHLLTHTSESSPPGSAFRYNGDRYQLLQGVVEGAGGRSFAELLVQRILRPLGLRETAPNVQDDASFAIMGLNRDEFLRNTAKPYAGSSGAFVPASYPILFGVAAGLMASAREVAEYSMAMDRDMFLRPETKAAAFTNSRTTTNLTIPYGLGWFVQQSGDVKLVWHYGLWTANSSLLLKAPAKGLTFVALANSDGLTNRYDLAGGNVLLLPVAAEFVRAFVTGATPLP